MNPTLEALAPLFGGLAQLAFLGTLALEFAAFYWLWPRFVLAASAEWPTPAGLGRLEDASALEGLEGHTGHGWYRGHPEHRAVLFRRRLAMIPGQRGSLVGVLHFDTDGRPTVRFRVFPASIPVLVLLVGIAVGGYAAIAEGSALLFPLLAGVVGLFAVFFWGIARTNATQLLDALLPELADALVASSVTTGARTD